MTNPSLYRDDSRVRHMLDAMERIVELSRGLEGLECGGWVMKGRATFWNYFRSGKWQFLGDR